jgi:hypothetical protein
LLLLLLLLAPQQPGLLGEHRTQRLLVLAPHQAVLLARHPHAAAVQWLGCLVPLSSFAALVGACGE